MLLEAFQIERHSSTITFTVPKSPVVVWTALTLAFVAKSEPGI